MVDTVFQRIYMMSVSGSLVFLIILFFRLFLTKIPKSLTIFLWAIVFFRLVSPFPLKVPISAFHLFSGIPFINTAFLPYEQDASIWPFFEENNVVPEIITYNNAQISQPLATSWYTLQSALLLIWASGLFIFLLLNIVRIFRVRGIISASLHLEKNIFEADHLSTPFVYGLIRPVIVLPAGLTEKDKKLIVLHEQSHIRYYDAAFKLIASVALLIHWFNPLVWVAYCMFSSDLEFACDERVIRKLDVQTTADYAECIVAFSGKASHKDKRFLSFSSADPKKRILHIIHYHRPSVWKYIILLALFLMLAACLLTSPSDNSSIHLIRPVLSNKTLSFGTTAERCSDVLGYPKQEELLADESLSEEILIYSYHDLQSFAGKTKSASLVFKVNQIEKGSIDTSASVLSKMILKPKDANISRLKRKAAKEFKTMKGGKQNLVKDQSEGSFQEHYSYMAATAYDEMVKVDFLVSKAGGVTIIVYPIEQ